MNPDYIKQIIEETILTTTTEIMNELKRKKLLKTNKDNAFAKTEKLLFSYNQFKKVIENKLNQIESIKTEGIAERSKDFVKISKNQSYTKLTNDEKIESKVEEISNSIERIKLYVNIIDDALEKICNDRYFDIIRMIYFEGLTREDIAFEFEVDVATITRNKNRLINILKLYLFTDDCLIDMFN